MGAKLNLPPELLAFEAKIRATSRPYLKIIPQKANKTKLWESKIGGFPYLPKDFVYPEDMEGNHLLFLAQINFEEGPALSDFPTKGILQFYVADDPFYGMELNDPFSQDGFRVLYFETALKDESDLMTDFSFLREFNPDPIDYRVTYPIHFKLEEEYVPTIDYEFDKLIGADFFYQFADKEWELWEAYNNSIKSGGHKLGGYAFFTQEDPRYNQLKPLRLLFQLDTDRKINCRWGDQGIANFFIDPKDLQALDFSKVFYNWDSL